MRRIAFLAVVPMVLWALSLPAAADSQSGKIRLSNHVVVSGVQLEPDEYVVRWDGNGPHVQVNFLRNGKEVVSLPGTLIQQKSQYNSVTTHLDESGTRTLREITFSKVKLLLTPPETSVVE